MAEQDLNAPVQLPQNIEGMNIHLSYIRRDLESINKKIDTLATSFVSHEEYSTFKTNISKEVEGRVTLQEFEPIKKLAYGSVAIILVTVLSAILYLVIK